MSDRQAPPAAPPGISEQGPALPDDLIDYLQAHRHAYTREALTGQLVQAGHDPAEVEAAWRLVEVLALRSQSMGSRFTQDVTVILGGLIVLVYGIGIALALLGASIGGSVGSHPGVMLGYGVGLAIAGGLALYSLQRLPQRRHRLQALIGTAVFAVVALVGLSGLCVSMVTQFATLQ
jgi:hypothetical protein